MYETNISNARWIAYDLPGNVGWIMYLVCTGQELQAGVTFPSLLSVMPAVMMLVGVVELISERIAKLDRVLPKKRLYRGFGALTFGGIAGAVVSAARLVLSRKPAKGINARRVRCMLIGSVLCAVFAGLLLAGYKKQEK